MEYSKKYSSEFYFTDEEEERIEDVAREIIANITKKHLTYAEAVEILRQCEVLLQERQII